MVSMRSSTRRLIAGLSAGTAAGLWAAYGLMLRPRHLRWGATDDEVGAAMPFDDVIPAPDIVSTRAITIHARPEDVWPFASDDGLLPPATRIAHIDPPHTILFAAHEDATWTVTLTPCAEGTRLVSRNRVHAGVLRSVFRDAPQFLFERQWLLDVKSHAEQLAAHTRSEDEVQVPELVP